MSSWHPLIHFTEYEKSSHYWTESNYNKNLQKWEFSLPKSRKSGDHGCTWSWEPISYFISWTYFSHGETYKSWRFFLSTASPRQEKLRKRQRAKKRPVQTDEFNESTAPLPAALCPSQCAQALSILSPNIFQTRAGLHPVPQRARGSAWLVWEVLVSLLNSWILQNNSM